VIVWGKRAEGLNKILHKGDRLFIEGGLRTSSYDDRDGNTRYKTEVVAQNVILNGKAVGGTRRDDEPARGPSSTDDDDDSPF
jgi:single-strand DNA-binding protein